MAYLTLVSAQKTQTFCVDENSLLSDVIGTRHTLAMPCGGKGRCGKCRVMASGRLSLPTAEERAALSEQELTNGVRLACCTRVLGDAHVTLFSAETLSQ
ncbi:MAG: 2Fe-2S iron-sulfur cluster-binding protein, partial [Ruthenibacterium sp.]